MKSNAESLQDLVRIKIENLRPKLLDLSRRNPLISTKLGPRSNSHLRAVDELPDVLFFKLNNGQEMDFVPLPPIEEDPRDEQTAAFREAVINARLTDESYTAAMEAVDKDADDYLDKTRTIERALRDMVRSQLGLAPRVQKSEINLTQHAKNNGILASYELPTADQEHDDGRHTDDKIQTLMLPSDLERKLNAITSKSRTWIQETGMNVLQIAFGFLEWSEDDRTDTSFAPLVLLQVEIQRTRTPQGARYSIVGTGDEPELNAILAEKLRIEFSVAMPKFDGTSIESYLSDVAKVLPKRKNWRIRRQVTVGVFPSARMAMYHDLNPKQPNFPQSDIVQSLLAGSEVAGASPFADEYEVDEPDIEAKVPCVVVDADSSQFSALVDIADGKNVAVEGPPGTGKSQTIVNAIAAALANNKKVLFVAEKLAALNVVKSRLEAVGLGEFLLPLQAEKSTRENVIESIRARLDMRDSRSVRDYDEKLREFRRIRKQLADYIEIITTEFGESGLTVHAILGKSIVTNDRLSGISNETLERCNLHPEMLTAFGFSTLLQLGSQIEKAHSDTLASKPNWKETRLAHPDRFTVEEACALAKRASDEALALAQARGALELWGIDDNQTLEGLKECLAACGDHLRRHSKSFLLDVLANSNADLLASFLKDCVALTTAANELTSQLADEPDDKALQRIRKVEEVCIRASLSTIDEGALAEQLKHKRNSARTAHSISAALGPLIAACEPAKTWLLDDIAKAHALCREAGREALALRTAKLLEDNATYHLRELCEEGRELQREQAALSERVNLSIEVSIDALIACASSLRTAGPLGFFSSSFRGAKRLFKSISRSGAYSKTEAIQSLDYLIAFRRKSDDFVKRAEASSLFGRYYRGLDTKYEPFERAAHYLERLSEQFGEPERATLHAFLRDAAVKQLDLLPAVPSTGVPITFVALSDRIAAAEGEVALLEGALADLQEVASVLITREIELADIQDVKHRLETLLLGCGRVDDHSVARELLGSHFNGHRTKAEHFEPAAAWAQSAGALASLVRMVLSRGDPMEVCRSIEVAQIAEEKLRATLIRLADIAKIDAESFMRGKTLPEAAEALEKASSDGEGLFAFATFASSVLEAAPHGIMPLIDERLGAGLLAGLGGQVEALAVRQLAKSAFSKLGSKLTKYRGVKLDELRASLAEKDKEIIQLSRRQLRAKVKADARPPMGNGVGKKSAWTNMALIENEISKKQRFIPVRDLTQRAGEALAELKPCWMMSPLAVAQYVPKGSVQFDLCIIDEASQMPPESAIGALLRCSQAVVVGDTNQLPPSSYFKTLIDDEEADDDEAVLNESVLEMANGSFRPARRLRWHYRSQHSGLIKFSNRLVYDDNLIVFPSATEIMARMGVEFRGVKGRYKASTNPVEAKAIIEAIIEFMQTDPDRSLGVVTLNQKQRDLITEEFEYAIANNRAVQKYIDTWKERNDGLEEFFIKNLENVQGDERDVIFIGTVYGAEEPGARVMQRFGPINGLAGKRRLNVLFTRAKQKVVTFSSMTAADIEAEENSNPGVYMLKRWLEYTASGVLDAGEITEREPDSDFEVFVIDQIKAMGCTPVPQVGVAGYFVDIGVRHPEWPHGFVLGVECDGATYHSAKSARDRDRLRQEILERLGWKLHRIWSTDWFNNPRQEAERLRKVIAERLIVLKAREHEYAQKTKEKSAPSPSKTEAKHDAEDLFAEDLPSLSMPTEPKPEAGAERRVEVGDTVRVRYLTDDKRTINVTISNAQSDASQGIIHYRTPIASALLGAEEGDEVEVLVGSYIRPAVVENIEKTGDSVSSKHA
jgi:transcription elongation GreA/GreB family factor